MLRINLEPQGTFWSIFHVALYQHKVQVNFCYYCYSYLIICYFLNSWKSVEMQWKSYFGFSDKFMENWTLHFCTHRVQQLVFRLRIIRALILTSLHVTKENIHFNFGMLQIWKLKVNWHKYIITINFQDGSIALSVRLSVYCSKSCSFLSWETVFFCQKWERQYR